MQEEIAKQLVYSNVDFFAGGGYRWFMNRSDSIDYSDTLLNRGFLDTNSIDTNPEPKAAKLAYLLAPDGLQPVLGKR